MAGEDADLAMAGSLVSTVPLLTKANVVRTETQTDDRGYEHVVYVTRAYWKILRDGHEPCQVTTEVERRYKEYYALYYLLAHVPVAMEMAFPRRVMWGSLSEGVVQDRLEVLDSWIQAVAGDSTAALEQIILDWLGLDNAQEQAQMVKEGREPPRPTGPPAGPPAAVPAASTASPSAVRPRPIDKIQSLVRKLVDEGFDEDELVDLVEITQDEELLRDLYAVKQQQPLPAMEASVIARDRWRDRYSVQLDRLTKEGYTDADRMAGLLEAFVGDVAQACSAYGSPAKRAVQRPPQAVDKLEGLVAKGYKDRTRMQALLEVFQGDEAAACEAYGPK